MLDNIHARILRGYVAEALEALFCWLNDKREQEGSDRWLTWIHGSALRHPIRYALHTDPFTASAFRTTQGFPGDARTLDYVYRTLIPELTAEAVGLSTGAAEIHNYIVRQRPYSHAIGRQCQYFASVIDRVALESPSARVLAIAPGHFRERFLSRAIIDRAISEVVVLDEDVSVLAEVERSCSGAPVRLRRGSVRDLLTDHLLLSGFDLVYAPWVFNYLSDRAAVALLEKLVSMIRPEGKVIIANFVPRHEDRGYLEAFMNSRLGYRSPANLWHLSTTMRPSVPVSTRTWIDESGSLVFMELKSARRS